MVTDVCIMYMYCVDSTCFNLINAIRYVWNVIHIIGFASPASAQGLTRQTNTAEIQWKTAESLNFFAAFNELYNDTVLTPNTQGFKCMSMIIFRSVGFKHLD